MTRALIDAFAISTVKSINIRTAVEQKFSYTSEKIFGVVLFAGTEVNAEPSHGNACECRVTTGVQSQMQPLSSTGCAAHEPQGRPACGWEGMCTSAEPG